MPLVVFVFNDDARGAVSKLGNTLPATAARRAEGGTFTAAAGDSDCYDALAARGNHGCDCAGLCATAFGIGSILDVGADVHAAILVDDGCADAKV